MSNDEEIYFYLCLCLVVLSFQASAEENTYNIIGLENIKREYEAGTKPKRLISWKV